MRKANIGSPRGRATDQFSQWVSSALKELERASYEEIPGEIGDAYTMTNFTTTRTLDAATATATDVANVLATFLTDLKARGVKKG